MTQRILTTSAAILTHSNGLPDKTARAHRVNQGNYMGYDRNDCWMTCGERDDACAKLSIVDPFAEIERLRRIVDLVMAHDSNLIDSLQRNAK